MPKGLLIILFALCTLVHAKQVMDISSPVPNVKVQSVDNPTEVESEEKELSEVELQAERERRLYESNLDMEGDDFLQLDPNLNFRYQKGPYLVYDCADQHWVCTGRSEYLRCSQERVKAVKERTENMGCTTFRKYPSLDSCIKAQQQITDRSIGTRFCLNQQGQHTTFRY